MTEPATLEAWLDYIERQHAKPIDLGLDRVSCVLERLQLPSLGTTFIVGGTNGKGSTCAMLEAMLIAAGYRVGLYTSPHLLRYNERVRIDGSEVSDALLIDAFSTVERVRGDVSLTYFEMGTLAAALVFAQAKLDAVVIEVGLGGRLDAVNAFDADCSIVTSIDLDHMSYLGDTREAIGWEKAHIYRAARPAICADPDPPSRLVEHARAIGADLQVLDRDFGVESDVVQWRYWGRGGRRAGLAYPALRGRMQLHNAAAAIAALDSVKHQLPVSAGAIRMGLARVEVPGRFQVLAGQPAIVLDVGHNPQAARVLAENLAQMGPYRRTIAVCGMLRDKDIVEVCKALRDAIDLWHVAGLPGARGTTAAEMTSAIATACPWCQVQAFGDIEAAFRAAREAAAPNDRIVVFGSFLTVAAVLASKDP